MPTLAETQAILWELIRAPEGVAQGLATLADCERRLPFGLDAVVIGDARLSAVARLDVYAGMYFFRIKDAIRENFPALARALGEAAYHDLCVDYLLARPSTHFSLREIGRHLEAFVRAHPTGRDVPWAADLAAFEWAFLEAFDDADAEPLAIEALSAVPPADWANLRLQASPSLRILDLGFALADARRQGADGGVIDPPPAEPTTYRLWRRDQRVHHRAIDTEERAALADVCCGKTFGDICARIADRVGDEAAPALAFAILTRWIGDGLIVRLD